jgi:hypothetical protein
MKDDRLYLETVWAVVEKNLHDLKAVVGSAWT